MVRDQRIDEVVANFGSRIGIEQLAFDESERASYAYDGFRFTLYFGSVPMDLLWIFVDLGGVNDYGSEALSDLLHLDEQAWSQRCLTVSIDDCGERVIGYASIEASELDEHRLAEVVARMSESASKVRQAVA